VAKVLHSFLPLPCFCPEIAIRLYLGLYLKGIYGMPGGGKVVIELMEKTIYN
jgi:hypothetical protein